MPFQIKTNSFYIFHFFIVTTCLCSCGIKSKELSQSKDFAIAKKIVYVQKNKNSMQTIKKAKSDFKKYSEGLVQKMEEIELYSHEHLKNIGIKIAELEDLGIKPIFTTILG